MHVSGANAARFGLTNSKETHCVILAAPHWIASSCFSRASLRCTKELRSRARIATAPALSRGKSLLLEGLNRKIGSALTMVATVDSVAVLGLFVTRDGLVVRAEAHGRAFVSVRQWGPNGGLTV